MNHNLKCVADQSRQPTSWAKIIDVYLNRASSILAEGCVDLNGVCGTRLAEITGKPVVRFGQRGDRSRLPQDIGRY
jgi:hypothetical protein